MCECLTRDGSGPRVPGDSGLAPPAIMPLPWFILARPTDRCAGELEDEDKYDETLFGIDPGHEDFDFDDEDEEDFDVEVF